MSKSTASVGCHLDLWNLQLTTACRLQMPATFNAGDCLAEIDQEPCCDDTRTPECTADKFYFIAGVRINATKTKYDALRCCMMDDLRLLYVVLS